MNSDDTIIKFAHIVFEESALAQGIHLGRAGYCWQANYPLAIAPTALTDGLEAALRRLGLELRSCPSSQG